MSIGDIAYAIFWAAIGGLIAATIAGGMGWI